MHREMGGYKEEEDLKPTQEELKYLEMRQRLKEEVRRRLKNESSSTDSHHQMEKKLPYDNYGSLFGPSRTVISKRVLEESKAILEAQHLLAKKLVWNTGVHNNKMGPVSANGLQNDVGRQPVSNPVDKLKKKAQKLKESRDYSFLFSDDVEFPMSSKESMARKASSHTSDQVTSKSKESLIRKIVQGPGRPLFKTPLQKASASMSKKNNSLVNVKPTVLTENKSKMIPMSEKSVMIPKHPIDKSKVMLKRPVLNLKPQMKLSKQVPSRPMHEDYPKKQKRPLNRYSDEEDMDDDNEAIRFIRSMFRYNPEKYDDADDVNDMEANFDDIMKEEKRSAKIAREEDARELRLIVEEERRAKIGKAAKKLKLM